MNLKNSYAELPASFYEKVQPEHFEGAKLISFNEEFAKDIGFEFDPSKLDQLTPYFSGGKLFDDSIPIAQAYAGFQFGNPVPQLGDGRACLLGELNGFDIQLKGSGRTRFSRGGDGKSALGPVLREYIVSEAMNSFGVPTTRALAALRSGEDVYRFEGDEPGGIFVRCADSHIRVGTFQYFAFRGEAQNLETLLDYTITRHYPELLKLEKTADKAIGVLKELTVRQSKLIAKWLSLGFIHGVMNTDNFSVAGITIDYGPCAFMDEFKFEKVFSSIDRNGRYAYSNQIQIAQWNILRFAETLIPLIHSDEKVAINMVHDSLSEVMDLFDIEREKAFLLKFGITDGKESHGLINTFLEKLALHELDFTLSFRELKNFLDHKESIYFDQIELENWREDINQRRDKLIDLDDINPIYIPRNHQIEKAIRQSYAGDDQLFHQLNKVLKYPFLKSELGETIGLSLPPRKEERITKTFCGT